MVVETLTPYLIIVLIMSMVVINWLRNVEMDDSTFGPMIIDRYVLNTSIKLSILSIAERETRIFILTSMIAAVKELAKNKKEVNLHLFIDNLIHYFRSIESRDNLAFLLGFLCSLKTNLRTILGKNGDLRNHVINLKTLEKSLIKLSKKM